MNDTEQIWIFKDVRLSNFVNYHRITFACIIWMSLADTSSNVNSRFKSLKLKQE
jgi:hypothetical protein